MAMKKITGRAVVRINGEILPTKNDAKAAGIGGFERKPVMLSTGELGFVEDVEASIPSCEVTMIDNDQISLTTVAKTKDAVITFEVPGAKSYIMRNAFCKANLTVSAGEGETPLIFYGDPWEESLAA